MRRVRDFRIYNIWMLLRVFIDGVINDKLEIGYELWERKEIEIWVYGFSFEI